MKNDAILRKIENFIDSEKLLSVGDTVILGVSGGADSVCLFSSLYELKKKYDLKLKVVCVDHGLRAEAKEEVKYVEELCRIFEADFVKREADVTGFANAEGIGTEEAGRFLRYAYFDEEADKIAGSVKIAVAHNKNDVAETFLFNLFRGTGPKGLGAMKPMRNRLIRPILCLERKEIEEYLSQKGLKYYTDASNLTDDYSRNKIRHHIVEYAEKEINDASVSHIAATADYIRTLSDIVEKQAEKSLRADILSYSNKEVLVKRSAFSEEESFIAGIKAKKCIDMLVPNNKDITATHLNAIKMISDKSETLKWDLPYDIHITASGEVVRFLLGEEEKSADCFVVLGERGSLFLQGLGTLEWEIGDLPKDFEISQKKYTKSFDYDKISQCLVLRKAEKGDYLTVNDKLQKKKLSDYFTNEKVPVFERDNRFVLADGNHIWWIPGMRISEYPKITSETKRIITLHINGRED